MPLNLGGTIDENGKLQVYAPDELRRYINAHRGEVVVLSIKLKKQKRSTPQNDYYWGVVVDKIRRRFNELGEYSFDDTLTHEFLKKEFNGKEVNLKNGNYVVVPESTTELSTIEFMIYLEKIKEFAATVLDIYIPDPNEPTDLTIY